MYESVLREKNERFAVVSLFATLLGMIGGLKDKVVDGLLEEYKEELYQLKYNSKYKTVRQRTISRLVAKAAEEARLLRKVESMSHDKTES